jgi:UDP-N-acetylmuramyl pentapeptide synthase
LGNAAEEHHESVGAEVAHCAIDELYCGGPYAASLLAGARNAGMSPGAVSIFTSNDEITDRLSHKVGEGDCVLLKGSRVGKMEQILRGLLAPGMLAS